MPYCISPPSLGRGGFFAVAVDRWRKGVEHYIEGVGRGEPAVCGGDFQSLWRLARR